MRPPVLRASLGADELVVDSFAGGGGASTGIEAAIGRPVDIAINHDPIAIAMHRQNHPSTRHYVEDIWAVDPREACGSRPVGLAWFSPDCTHFSRAKGNVPRSKEIRGLAWVVIRWAREVAPRIIILENVEEFATWGPLDAAGRPDRERTGETFREWLGQLTDLGYAVEFRPLVAADYGTPTTRRRLFLVARRDGHGVVWPAATHGAGRPAPWRPAAEVIDWSLPCPSIFGRRRPLAEATMRRIAAGIRRFVLTSAEPFIVPVKSWSGGGNGPRGIDEPMRTVTASKRGEFALVSAFLARHFGGVVGRDARQPVPTVTARDHHSLGVAWLTKFYGTARAGSSAGDPVPTITAGAGGGHLAAVRAFLVKYYGAGGQQQALFDPLHTVTAKARFGLVTIHGQDYQIADIGMRMLQPHELFKAQGFPEGYEIEHADGRRLTKTQQVALAGNSVCPPVAAAVVGAQLRNGAEVAA